MFSEKLTGKKRTNEQTNKQTKKKIKANKQKNLFEGLLKRFQGFFF